LSAVYPDFLVEHDDAWRIDANGLVVTRCSFDWSVTLLLADPALWFSVRIGQPFLIRREGSVDETWVDPERRPPDAPPVLVLLDLAVESIRIVKDGRLDLALANDWRVEVPQGTRYEAFVIGRLPSRAAPIAALDEKRKLPLLVHSASATQPVRR
jgi:hypothetical protein